MFSKTIYSTLILLLAFLVPSLTKASNISRLSAEVDSLQLVVMDSLQIDSIATDSLAIDTKKKSYISEPVNYTAEDSIVISLAAEKMYMYNQAKVAYTTQELSANYIEMDISSSIVTGKYTLDTAGNEVGYPVFKDGGEEFEMREVKVNTETKKLVVEDILTEEQGGYIQSKVAKKVSEDTFFLKDGKYTTCDNLDHPHYYIRLRKAKMIKDDKVVSGFANIYLEDVPTPLALPFGLFPLTTRFSSGFVMPSFGEENRRGFFLRDMGYYWAASEYFDLLFSSTIYTNGSWESRARTNYSRRYKFKGNFSFSYAENKIGDKGLPDYSESKDFSIRWTHNQDAKAHPYRTLSASVNISSSQNDYNNSNSLTNIVNSTKQSSIAYSRRWPDSPFNLSIAFQHSQNRRDTSISLTLPNASFTMSTQYPFRSKERVQLKWYDKISMGYSANMRNSVNIHEDKLFDSDLRRDWKNGFQHSIPIGASYKVARDLTFSANLNYTGVAYMNSVRKSWDPISEQVVTDTLDGFNYAHNFTSSTSLSYTPRIYGMFVTKKKDARIKALRHVMSPSIGVSYTPEFGLDHEQYFRTYSTSVSDYDVREYSIYENGIYGTPAGGIEAGNINFGLDNNLEMKIQDDKDSTNMDATKKVKILESLRFSTSYNIFRDSLNLSPVNISGRTSIFNKKVNIQMGGTLNPYALSETGTTINKFNGGIGRLTSANFSVSTSFKGGDSSKNKKRGGSDEENEDALAEKELMQERNSLETLNDLNQYVDFDVPWSMRLDYNFRYSKPTFTSTTSQILRLSGDLSLTPKWKISFNTGYDISKTEVTTTSFSIFRDLHCWEMSFNAIPFGDRQSYSFRINVKSSLLKDLKYQKNDSWYDN